MTQPQPAPEQAALMQHELMMQASAAYRLQQLDVRVDGAKLDFRRFPYLLELYDLPLTKDPLDLVVIKGAQMGFTVWIVLYCIDRAQFLYERQIGIYFPTTDDVSRFSKTRFAPMIQSSARLSNLVRETNSTQVKRVGRVNIIFNGMRSRSGVKSDPNDLNVYDERDEMEDHMVELADHRLDGSQFKHRISNSTPTIPDYGVHREFQESDQRHWFLQCQGCGKRTCLENEFPQCLQRQTDGTAKRVCIHCQHEVWPTDGQWFPMVEKAKRRGYYVSQLNSSTVSPTTILDEYERKQTEGEDLTEFYNSRLGRAHANIEDCLEPPMLLRLCKDYDRARAHASPTAAGIDVGKVFHWWVGEKLTDRHHRLLNWGTCDEPDEVAEMLRRYSVQSFVIDQMAETRLVRDFVANTQGGFGCYYSDQQRQFYKWDQKESQVVVNRTESLDASHALVVGKNLDLPRADHAMRDELIPQLCNLARTSKVNGNTGRRENRWVIRGAKRDHWRHALNYYLIASERVSAYASQVARRSNNMRGLRVRRGSFMSA